MERGKYVWVRLFVVAAGLLIAALVVLPLWRCPFRAVTGLPCPGCGMTTALLALVRGDLAGAAQANGLIFALPLWGAALAGSVLWGRGRLALSPWFWGSLGGLFLLHWGWVLFRLL